MEPKANGGASGSSSVTNKAWGWAKEHPVVAALIAVAATGLTMFVIFAIIAFTTLNGIQKDGTDRETRLNASYLAAQNELGTLVSTVKEQMGVANVKSEQLDAILTDAVKGRYEEGSSAVGATGGGQLISALVEAYPDLKGLDSYDRVLDAISSGREAYKNKQNVLLDQLREYDKWRRSGIIHKILVGIVGFPSDGLEARLGKGVTHGQAALDQMYVIVLPKDALDAYESGTFEGIEVTGPAGQQ